MHEGPPAERCSARPRETKGGPLRCCTPVWISVASVSSSTCSTQMVGPSSSARHRLTRTGCRNRKGSPPPQETEEFSCGFPVRLRGQSNSGVEGGEISDRLPLADDSIELSTAGELAVFGPL